MPKAIALALVLLAAIAFDAVAEPPADLDACIALSAKVAREAGAKIKSEAEYAKFYIESMSLDSACGSRDFAEAERVANEIASKHNLDLGASK